MYRGLDLLGLAMMDAKAISKSMHPNCSFGFLMGTFGDALPNAEYILTHNSPPACRVHLSNGPCARNKNCGDGEIGPRDFGKLGQRAAKIEELAVKYTNTKFYICPRVEHDEKKDVVRRWLSVLQNSAPSCTPVISCGPKGVILPHYLVEEHGNDCVSAVVSNDGVSILDAGPHYYNRGTILALAWDYSCNFRQKNESHFTYPRNRDLKLGPTPEMLQKMQELMFI